MDRKKDEVWQSLEGWWDEGEEGQEQVRWVEAEVM